jgi:abortive infection bacteriophage resistance protein
LFLGLIEHGMGLTFSKPSLTYAQQIEHLRAKGLLIADAAVAEYWLRHVSYYRLSAYWLYFEHPKDTAGPRFRSGTTFEAVTALYDFDRNLRRIVMRGTEHIEVALRGSWAYQLAHSGGPHAYLNASLYRDRREFRSSRRKLQESAGRSAETYIDHYRTKYSDPKLPPVWMVAEMMSFGQLSRWYSNLRERALRNRIAAPLGLPETVLVPLVRHVTDMRNICAHHGRLWNRGFLHPPKLAQKPNDLHASLDLGSVQAPAKLYNGLTTIAQVIRTVAPDSTWSKDLAALVETNPVGDFTSMGFPADWMTRPLWK